MLVVAYRNDSGCSGAAPQGPHRLSANACCRGVIDVSLQACACNHVGYADDLCR